MAVITISLTPKGLREFAAAWPNELDSAKFRIAERMRTQGRALVEAMLGRWQTGKLASSLEAWVSAVGIGIELGGGIDYADYVMFGAEPHIIKPKTGRALSWRRFGMRFAFGKVEHPGQPARTDIFNALEELFLRIVEEEITAMITALALAGAGS